MPGLPFNLDDLVRRVSVENNRVEFKGTWNDPVKAAVARTICAFANDLLNLNGGYLLLGIETDDQGHPILPPQGLDGLDLDLLQREIRGQCRRFEPEYQPVIFPEIYEGKQILLIWAPGGANNSRSVARANSKNLRLFGFYG